MTVVDLEKTVKVWRNGLCPSIALGGLISRSPVAHKWKATYRSIAKEYGVNVSGPFPVEPI